MEEKQFFVCLDTALNNLEGPFGNAVGNIGYITTKIT